MLHGRDEVIGRIATVIEGGGTGRGGALLITGEPGQGKTTILDSAAALVGQNWLVLRCCGTEPEAALRYAGLHQLLAPLPDTGTEIPEPTREICTPVTGAEAAYLDDHSHRVGLAILTLWTELAAERPMLCLIDDAQWWDRPSLDALSFALRRLTTQRVAVLMAARGPHRAYGMPEVELTPLTQDDSRALLAERLPRLPADTFERVLDTAAGNPLALLEHGLRHRPVATFRRRRRHLSHLSLHPVVGPDRPGTPDRRHLDGVGTTDTEDRGAYRCQRALPTQLHGDQRTVEVVIQAVILLIIVDFERSDRPIWTVGVVLGAAGVGGIIGSTAAAWLATRFGARQLYRCALWCWTVLLVPIASSSQPLVVGAAWFGVGAVGTVVNVALTLFRVEHIPEEVLGRAVGTVSMVTDGAVAARDPRRDGDLADSRRTLHPREPPMAVDVTDGGPAPSTLQQTRNGCRTRPDLRSSDDYFRPDRPRPRSFR